MLKLDSTLWFVPTLMVVASLFASDVTTAVMCIDRLGALLRLLADRQLASPLRAAAWQVRVLTLDPDFAGYLGTAFDQIRANYQELRDDLIGLPMS